MRLEGAAASDESDTRRDVREGKVRLGVDLGVEKSELELEKNLRGQLAAFWGIRGEVAGVEIEEVLTREGGDDGSLLGIAVETMKAREGDLGTPARHAFSGIVRIEVGR